MISPKVVVPAAGADFVSHGGGVKALVDFDGEPLWRRVLTSRPWYCSVPSSSYSFVFRDLPETRRFAREELADWFPGSTVIFLEHVTQGAALSAAAAMVFSAGLAGSPLIVDLADIRYRVPVDDPLGLLAVARERGAVALTFSSSDPRYSYLSVDAAGRFLEAAEKRVISQNASAGTYLFADESVYFGALSHALANPQTQTHRGLFYVCPLFNGVRELGLDVQLQTVVDVRDMKVGAS